jgi:DNA helicase II / ATP-dependent DNA helicase PcrA
VAGTTNEITVVPATKRQYNTILMMMSSLPEHLLNGLTDPQREAVTHIEGPLLILAGPGSGKTRVVTHRVAWLLANDVPGRQILALTFTNKAADEMARRIEELAETSGAWVGTFHRFAARLLRKYAPLVGLQENYTIYDVADSSQALRRAMVDAKLQSERLTPETLAKEISWAKNRLIAPRDYPPRPGSPLGLAVAQVYPLYQAQLLASNAADFDDLLLHLATLLRDNPEVRAALDERYRFILVDEYQDTNLAQYAIARALSIDYPNLAVTGDPDQSIYGWRGANLNNILEFERDFPQVRVVRLERNYRSTKRILHVASELIGYNIRRKEKSLFTENGPGKPVRLITYATQHDEADGIAAQIAAAIRAGRRRPSDFAIFYRVNALSRAFEFALRELGVPYQMVNGLEFFQRKEIKDVLAYLHLLNNPRDGVALLRVINTPPRGIGKTTVARLSDFAARHGGAMLEAARRAHEITGIGPRIAAKLRQFVDLFDRLAASLGGPMEETLGFVLSESGYHAMLGRSESEEDQERLANIEELLTVAREFDERSGGSGQLEAFLEETSLVNDTDAWEVNADRVTLMTLHASKGLEFPVVFLTAVEEGLLPHERSRKHPEQLEEERRLMFVGITRAQQELQISHAIYRDFRGQRTHAIPSSFLMELPRHEMDVARVGAEGTVGQVYAADPFSQVLPDDMSALESVMNPQLPGPEFNGPGGSEIGASGAGRAVAKQIAAAPPSFQLTTAAELANGGSPSPPTDPDVFRQGMLVRHPTLGLGRVVALSGSGPARKATIDFTPAAGRKSFVLSKSPLRPVKADER